MASDKPVTGPIDGTKGRAAPTEFKRVAIDTSKHVFTVHGVDQEERPVLRRELRRAQVEAFFGKLAPTEVVLEACCGSHPLGTSFEPAEPPGKVGVDSKSKLIHSMTNHAAPDPAPSFAAQVRRVVDLANGPCQRGWFSRVEAMSMGVGTSSRHK